MDTNGKRSGRAAAGTGPNRLVASEFLIGMGAVLALAIPVIALCKGGGEEVGGPRAMEDDVRDTLTRAGQVQSLADGGEVEFMDGHGAVSVSSTRADDGSAYTVVGVRGASGVVRIRADKGATFRIEERQMLVAEDNTTFVASIMGMGRRRVVTIGVEEGWLRIAKNRAARMYANVRAGGKTRFVRDEA
jgi:hypothetical protein